ncbi:MAG: tRNA 2-selenouridine(34) synthase MnmH, partial [Alphaproteobacteria bacterium]|nr:tRNA 2-selenouridine(34) synthase MnmH [Alphaproteobacteria bacterium]
PRQRMIESLIFARVRELDLTRPVLIEAESSRIGTCHIPQGLWKVMHDAPQIHIDAAPSARVDFLMRDYPHLISQPERLDRLIDGMISRHGHEVTAQWRGYVEAEDWPRLVEALISQHYDPAYATTSGRKGGQPLARLTSDALDQDAIETLARQISAIFSKM